ncbi:MAG TPA: DUF4337 domain-containing protein [Chloroflexota bacterium]|nr:DUF4337 domain-containing protein [Chloroflexota bacterium]
MEAEEAADHVREASEAKPALEHPVERFRTRAAITIAVLGMLLAIASLGGDDALKQTLNANVRASDTYAFYQAKNIRQTAAALAADELDTALRLHPDVAAADVGAAVQQQIADYQAQIAEYESAPDPEDPTNPLKGEGKQQLLAQARDWEAKRDRADAQHHNFDYSRALFQIAIVLGSVAILAVSRPVLWLALALGGGATLLMLNGFFLLVDLPGAG